MTKTYDIPVIVVEIRGGLVEDVIADTEVNARVIIVDHDDPASVREYEDIRVDSNVEGWVRGLGYDA